jgi:hypothetical protein
MISISMLSYFHPSSLSTEWEHLGTLEISILNKAHMKTDRDYVITRHFLQHPSTKEPVAVPRAFTIIQMGKASKATKKFASSGQLKKVIQARHKHQQIRKRTQGKRGARDGKEKPKAVEQGAEEDNEEEIPQKSGKGYVQFGLSPCKQSHRNSG